MRRSWGIRTSQRARKRRGAAPLSRSPASPGRNQIRYYLPAHQIRNKLAGRVKFDAEVAAAVQSGYFR
jgi:hypothetical protein